MALTRCLPTVLTLISWGIGSTALAQDDIESPPIAYSTTAPDNCISRLQAKLDDKSAILGYDRDHGYLKAVLAALNVPIESQVLVFSKTSLQLRRISPRTPRALYFNDDVYIGFCQHGDVLEVSASDPLLGTVFYSLDQRTEQAAPKFERQVDNCLVCHSSSRTENVPGHLVRSLYVDHGGHPILSAGSRSVNHTTPFHERWGGWYVTGKHGDQQHLGNLVLAENADTGRADNSAGQNVVSLEDRFDVSPYLSPHSDIVALMVLEHQVLVHNRLTAANYTARQALSYEAMMNNVLKKPAGTRLESTTRRIQSAGDKLVEALLLAEEAPLTAPIEGTAQFATYFAETGPRDAQGRSLRQLDLRTRLFKHPCSYLIYSESFSKLPDDMRAYVWQRLWNVLTSDEPDKKFAHLTLADRAAIVAILRDTVPNLPDYWRKT